jgi:hypothetical protein
MMDTILICLYIFILYGPAALIISIVIDIRSIIIRFKSLKFKIYIFLPLYLLILCLSIIIYCICSNTYLSLDSIHQIYFGIHRCFIFLFLAILPSITQIINRIYIESIISTVFRILAFFLYYYFILNWDL